MFQSNLIAPINGIKMKKTNPKARIPVRQKEFDSGADLFACLNEPLTLLPGNRALVPTGIAIELPLSYEGQVRSRSGLAANHGLAVLNAPGSIDFLYRGEIKVILINHGNEPYHIKDGERIAQLVIAPVFTAFNFLEVDELSDTDRGVGGFGSTGKQ